MKIENEQQATKYKRYLEVAKESMSLESELGINNTLLDISAALAAYESRKIELSEDELLCLKWRDMAFKSRGDTLSVLIAKGMISESLFLTPAGRAYLDQHKARELEKEQPPLKFEVWQKGNNTRIGVLTFRGIAKQLIARRCEEYNEPETNYEVREIS